MKFTLRQLQVFLAAAKQQNITRAAQELAMSQSAASAALKELESQFDVQLFDRVGKRLQLNSLGREVRAKSEVLLDHAGELQQLLARGEDSGNLRVGATLTIGNYLAVPILARYRADYPAARVVLEVANTQSIAAQVNNFSLDIGLIEGELGRTDLEVIPWQTDELVVFCHPGHPWAHYPQLTDAELIDADWIVREPGSGTRQAFDHALRDLQSQLNIVLELQHTEAIQQAVESGLGIGCVSRIAVADALQRGSLVELKVPQRNWLRNFYFVLHPQKYRSRSIQRWIEYCKNAQA